MTYLAAEAGIRQFLDVGTGIPTAGNTHEVAQAVGPACRVVYVDNDPVVLSHARALLRSAEGGVSFLDADARDPATVIAGAGRTLDFSQPVGIIMIDMLDFLDDADGVLAGLSSRCRPAATWPSCSRRRTSCSRSRASDGTTSARVPVILRDRATVEGWFTDLGLELVEPGLVQLHRWRPEPDDPRCSATLPLLGAVARKP